MQLKICQIFYDDNACARLSLILLPKDDIINELAHSTTKVPMIQEACLLMGAEVMLGAH
jgi:hypothetical protein